MSTLTIRLPDVTALSLQDLAHTRGPGMGTVQATLIHQSPTPMVDFLFLDFDGVLHPQYDGGPTPKEVCFCHLPRFEAVMRQHPGVLIVISSTWRQQFSLAQLHGYFGADIAQRIVGVTPSYPAEGPPRLHVREWEILQWLQTHQASHRPWLALDDSQGDFRDCRHRVVFCHPWEGLTEHRATQLHKVLQSSDMPRSGL